MLYITSPENMTRDCTNALAMLYPDMVQTIPGSDNGRSLLRAPVDPGRVNTIVSAGGAGGPFSSALAVSPLLADAGVNGGMFAAPSAYDIYEAARYINSPHGYLLIFNNYMGDLLNNDLALELMALDGLKGRMVAFHDDCLSVDPDAPREERTGLLGLLYAVKAASALSREGASLETIADTCEQMNDRTSSLILTFDPANRRMMLGEGISGEPPRLVYQEDFSLRRGAALAYDYLIRDLQPRSNEKIFVLVGSNFHAGYEETYILASHLQERSNSRFPIHRINAGHYMYTSESYGFTINMLCADESLVSCLEKRAFSNAFIL